MVFLQLILRDQEALRRGRGVGSLSPLLSSSPRLAAEASSAMQKLCSTAARGEQKLHGIFQLSLQLEEHGKNQQSRGVFLTPVQSFAGICLHWGCTLCSGGRGVGTCQLWAVPQSLLPLIPWFSNTHSTQVDALGQHKVPQTLGSAGNPKAIPDFTQWECIERVLDSRFILWVSPLCPWIFQTAVLINLFVLRASWGLVTQTGFTQELLMGGCPQMLLSGSLPGVQSQARVSADPQRISWASTQPGLSQLTLEGVHWAEVPQAWRETIPFSSHSVSVCAQPCAQAISTAALMSSGVFGRICPVICISWLEKLYLGHQAVREGKLISHPAPSLPRPAAGTGPPGQS